MAGKNDLRRGFKAKAEKLGISVRKDLDLNENDPLDAFMLAKYFDIPIYSVENIFEDCMDHPAFKKLNSNDEFNAMLMKVGLGKKIIIHNTGHSAKRQQSNLMHELSHHILEHDVDLETARIAMQYGMKYVNDAHENEAKFLGGCLQISRPGLLWAAKTMSESEMSDYFTASAGMITYRLRVTGVLRQLGNTRN